MYRDLVYGTAELVSRDLPVADLLERAVDLGKAFFDASSLEIRLRDADLAYGTNAPLRPGARVTIDRAAAEVLRSGVTVRGTDATSMHVPIRFGSDVRGVISIASASGATFDDVDASLFEKWALLLAVRIHELHLCAANARLEVLAGMDGLTGIHNRRAFGESLAQAWERAAQTGTSLAIAMIDVDFFKSYNDKYGHVAGDACLKQIAQTIALSLRAGDVLGRYGGEEFAVFFEATSLEAAIEVSERLRENIFTHGTPHLGSRLGRVTASVGVAAVVPTTSDAPGALLERADAALYEAKARGRNRVVAEAYVSESNAALPSHDVRNNLPTPASSFCARQDDAQRLRAALDESRLVTLAGFGGVGKTRLALEVAGDLVAHFADGVWFVDLAGTRDPDVIPGLVAAMLDVRDPAASSDPDALAERCRHKALLLVLDNCEHLKRDCARFAATLLRKAPRIRVLATSREPLDAPDEVVVLLGPFALPESGTLGAEEALRIPAVRLFVDRARAVTPFELRDDNVADVIDLCRRVDGIALGIELAAARLKMLSLEQLRGKLDRRFALLGRKGSNVAARQQTLRALIDWSFELLSPAERTLFRRLGIFAGSFTFEAASLVCADEDAGLDVLDTLDALVDKSLLVVETRREGQHTFRFFESIRSYARDRLAASGELEDLEARHREYYRSVAAAADAAKATPDWQAALRPLEFAANDLRAVLESTLGNGLQPAMGADLAAKLTDYWQTYGAVREGRTWLECALRSTDDTFVPDLRARVRLALLDLQTMGEARAGLDLVTDVITDLGPEPDPSLDVQATFHLGRVHCILGDMKLGSACLEAAQQKSQGIADPLIVARASNLQGMVACLSGDDDKATAFFTRSEQLFHRLNRTARAVVPLGNLAEIACERGDFDEAIDVAKRALAIAERSGDRASAAWLLGNLGLYYLGMHDTDSAASFTHDSLRIAIDTEDQWQVITSCDVYARLAYERGDISLAAQLLGYADQHLAELRVPRQPAEVKRMEELAAALRAALGAERAERRVAEGRALSSAAMLELVNSGTTNLLPEPRLAS
ncbi:MAG: diguanylate cyclase [Candidatus Eremiobacteraeota bacterium]|nr:diguanylate cyclase [Candidatus Eremiobacteraeota bacterium]MBC5821198.1 diguanylate cyclase [Candidatus Eremiobacteraeota bacterium]